MSFASPTAAMAAIVDCLDGMCSRVHVGSRDSGLSLDCCPGCLLRVEEGGTRPRDPTRRSFAATGCRPLVLDVIVVYRTCFQTSTDDGEARSVAELTEAGTAVTLSWFDAVERLSCCKPANQSLRLVQVLTDAPEGNCAGWTMTLEADLELCGPC